MVNPKVRIPPIVRKMTGINQSMVKDAPTAKEIMPSFMSFIEDSVLVSHNTLGDLKFLKHFALKVCNRNIDNFFLCTHLLSERLAPEAKDKSLTGLGGYFSLDFSEKHHRAKADALLTVKLFEVLIGRLKENSIDNLCDAIRFQGDLDSGVRIGWEVPQRSIDKVPSKCGVLRFFDRQDHLLFSISSFDMRREIRKIANLSLAPKRVARELLKATKLDFEVYENLLEAFDAESYDEVTHQLRVAGETIHGRSCSALNLEAFEAGTRVFIGSPTANTKAAFGKVIDKKKIQSIVSELIGRYGHKSKKKGYVLEAIDPSLVKEVLEGQTKPLKQKFAKKTWASLINKRIRLERQAVNKYLSLIPENLPTNNLVDYFSFSGALISQAEQEQHYVYPVAHGTVLIAEKIKTDKPIEHFLSESTEIEIIFNHINHYQLRSMSHTNQESYFSRSKASLWVLDGCWPDNLFHGFRFLSVDALKRQAGISES